MKLQRTFALLIGLCFCSAMLAIAQDMDAELSKMTKGLATKIKANTCKKVAVLDFTDLQGNSSELGRYVAEQLTVELVMDKDGFAVMDRANLKKILEEHKLTATGLVDPENAKQLGKFSGVDALILGNIATIGTNISVAVKVITTESAEIVTAAKTKFASDDTLQQLLSASTQAGDDSSAAGGKEPPLPSKKFGNLNIVIKDISFFGDGTCLVSLTFQNKNTKKPIAVAMYHDVCYMKPCPLRTSLVAGDGTQFQCDDSGLTGIGSTRFSPVPLKKIAPNEEIDASVRLRTRGRISETVASVTFQSEIMVNQDYKERMYDNYRLNENELPPGCKVENLVMEIHSPK